MLYDNKMDTSFIVRTFRIIIILSASVGFLSPESISAQQAPKFDIDSSEIGTIVVKETFLGTFAQYMPTNASDILILVHGYPWADGSRTMSQLADHVTEYAQKWKPFADEQHLLLLIPAFGSNEFLGYRDLFGTHIDADMFVNFLVDHYGSTLIDSFDGTFFLYGHSAGGQFAARFTVTHPQRLKKVILSAPGRYAFPNPEVSWPNGMGACMRDEAFSGTPETGKDPTRSGGTVYQPVAHAWIMAATSVPIAIVIGSEDVEVRSP